MTRRSGWRLMLIVAALLATAAPDGALAQAPPRAPQARPNGTTPAAPAVPESSVSPIIARFMKQTGQDLAPLAAPVPPTINPSRIPSSPIAPPMRFTATAARAAAPRLSRDLQDLPSPLPPSLVPAAEPPASRDATNLPPSPLFFDTQLKPAPFGPTDLRLPINLATALRLSDARPLVVAAAQAGVWIAEADLTRAKVLWIPTINLAVDYLRHDGGGPDFNKGVLTAPSTNFFYGGGALYGIISTAEVIYEPLVARQVLNSRTADIQTAKNDALMRTADAYFQVHQYRGTYAGALYCVERGRELVRRITALSRDLAQPFEIDRSRNMLVDLEQRAVMARQEWRIQSANLTEVLRLDPRAIVEPLEHDHIQITLVDPARPLEDLMAIALTNRPELSSRRSLVNAAQYGIDREKARMLLPSVELTGFQSPGGMLIQAGLFGLGPNSSLNYWTGREDVSVQLMWQLEGFGAGNLARIKRERGRQSDTIIRLREAQDMVAADVTRAQARVQSASARVLQADRSVRTGLITYNGQIEGLSQTNRFGDVLTLVNRPQGAVYALQLLFVAFEEYFSTVAEYNRAQFDLYHALGYPAAEVALNRPPGDVQPVDTSRPRILPMVGNGPPPATR